MSAPKDGGQAFPTSPALGQYGRHIQREPGMSLRDYFAAAALQGILRSQDNRFLEPDDAKWCYAIADAMLEARKGK